MRRILIAVVCSLTASMAVATEPLPTYEEAGLRWKDPPKVVDMARFYPRGAAAARISQGVAEVACTPVRTGKLTCTLTAESPQGAGFGKAGLMVMKKVTVRAVDGGDPTGRSFGFRLKFGRWKASALPAGFQPGESLRWAKFPTMTDWSMQGQDRYETWKADFKCRARADGRIDCVPSGIDPVAPRFAAAAAGSLEKARVKKKGGGSPEGIEFDWTVSVMRQNWCSKSGPRTNNAESGATHVEAFGDSKSGLGSPLSDSNCSVSQVQTR